MECGVCILKTGNRFNLQDWEAFSGCQLAWSLWHWQLDSELLPCVQATLIHTCISLARNLAKKKKKNTPPCCVSLHVCPTALWALSLSNQSSNTIQLNPCQTTRSMPGSRHREKRAPALKGLQVCKERRHINNSGSQSDKGQRKESSMLFQEGPRAEAMVRWALKRRSRHVQRPRDPGGVACWRQTAQRTLSLGQMLPILQMWKLSYTEG